MSTQTKIKTKASDMLVLAILAYLLTLIAPLLGSLGFVENNPTALLIIRAVCIVAWVFGAWGLVHTSKKECGYNVIDKANKPSALQWILTAAATVLFIVYCLIDSADDIVMSITNLRSVFDYLLFITYYVMNAAQALVVTLIIVFAQKACDKVFGLGKYIPYGGITLGLCWAIANLLSSFDQVFSTTGDIITSALWILVYGIVFGIIYLLSGKKAIYALPFIAVAFVLM